MLDQNRISIGKLRLAFALTPHDAKELIYALPREAVFPFAIWEDIYKKYWEDHVDVMGKRVNLTFSFPITQFDGDIINDNRQLCYDFVTDIAPIITLYRINDAFPFLFELVYGELSDSVIAKAIDHTKTYFMMAFEFTETEEYTRLRSNAYFSLEGTKILTADMKETFTLRTADKFFQDIFPDTIVVDKKVAIKHLISCGYPLEEEVKGVSRVFYDFVANEALTQTPSMIIDTPSSPLSEPTPDIIQAEPMSEPEQAVEKECEQVTKVKIETPITLQSTKSTVPVPSHLWEGKSPKFIRDTMRQENFNDAVIAYVLFTWCKINKTQVGRLLIGDNKEDSTCRKACNELLVRASEMNISAC